MGSPQKDTTRLDFRLAAPIKGLIEQAARCSGQTTTAFAIATLTQRAQRVLEEHSVIRLSNESRDRFLAILEEDIQPNDRLRRAAERYRQGVVE